MMLLALGIVLAQLLVACLMSGRTHFPEAYGSLFQWDGNSYYAPIAEAGYRSPPQLTREHFGNVAFFPGYPCLGWLVAHLLHVPMPIALLIAAQACCWGFWTYLFLLCRRLRVPSHLVPWAVLLIALHPASFFLVASYSESLFLLCALGFLFWSDRPGLTGALLAALHGFAMTATRLVGIPLVIYPLLRTWLRSSEEGAETVASRVRRSLVPGLLGLVASMGAVSFFVFCQMRFGQWDLYMKTEEVGWGVRPNYLCLFSWRLFYIGWPHAREGFLDPGFVDRVSVLAYLAIFGALVWIECRLRGKADAAVRERLGLYGCAWLLFYVPLCGHFSRCMGSMIRFELCVIVMLALAVLHLLGRIYPERPPRWIGRLIAGWSAVSVVLLLAATWRFTHGMWGA
jgi:hypothetical protein